MNTLKTIFAASIIICAGLFCTQAQAQPIVTFVRANIGDSAKVVQERAFDVLLEKTVNATSCLKYIDSHKRDSLAEDHARKHEPFTFKEIASEMGAKYGAFFSLERFGFILRLGTRIVTPEGTLINRNDFTPLLAEDTSGSRNAYEPALERLMTKITAALANAVDTSCSAPPDSVLPIVMGSVVIHKMDRGFGMFLSDNATRISDMAGARMLDSLRQDKRFLLIDIYSRDQLYARLGEYDIQNNVLPSAQEIALMNAAGLPVYLTAEIDSADAYKKLTLRVFAFSTVQHHFKPIAQTEKVVGPEMEGIYTTLNELAYKTLEKLVPPVQYWKKKK
jgi:hypothetical protein